MKRKSILYVFSIALAVFLAWAPNAMAYGTYSAGCVDCHGGFRTSPYTSLTDGQSWNDDLHDVHRNSMLDGDCNTCHSGSYSSVSLDSSAGGNGLAPISCVGCHGREEDMGNDSLSAGRGAGLRQHHTDAGVSDCGGCHSDAIPANYSPVGEDILPAYYFTPDANHPNKPTDPCTDGLDNDGDGVYENCQAANTPPVAADDAGNMFTTDEDSLLDVAAPGVLSNDSDADGNPLTASLKTGVSNGTLTLNTDGSFSYTPNLNFFGEDIFTYVASDGVDNSNSATVTITVNGVNDSPAADPKGPYSQTVGSSVPFNGSGSSDVDGTIVSYDWNFGDGSTGTSATPTHTYGVAGTYTVTLTVTDNGGATDTAATTANISPIPNSAPVAVNDSYTTDEDTELNVVAPGVLANDTDADSDPLTASLITGVSNGTLTLNADDSFSYTPNQNFSGTDTFTYQANDSKADSNTATVTITVNPVNDPPVADPNGPYSQTVGVPVTFDGSGSSDMDGTIASYAWNFGDNSTDTSVNPTHAYGQAGTFTVTLTVTDDGGATHTAATTATISDSPNTPPVAVDDSYTTDEDTPLDVAAPGVLENDYDADAEDALNVILITDVSNGTLTLKPDGSFNYMPSVNFSGTATFAYRANDGKADSNTATVTITVKAVNDSPEAVNDNYTMLQNTLLTDSVPGVLGNDSDPEGDALTANLASDVASGTLSLNSNGSFTYTPISGFTGVDSFTYVANDGLVDSNPTTVKITVQAGPNQQPVAVDDSATTAEETPVTVDVLANDSDADGDALTVVAVGVAADGTAMDNGDGTVTYTPNSNFTGIDSFTYTIQDGQGGSSSATVTLEVTPVNDPPVANGDTYSRPQDTMLNVAAPGVLVNDIDPDGDALSANLISNVANGTLYLGSDGSFDYTPNPGFTGTDSFTYVATDGLVDSNEATVTITADTAGAGGAGLYAVNCASCHGELPNSNVCGKDAENIMHAIEEKNIMRGLRSLTDDQVKMIADALSSCNSDSDHESDSDSVSNPPSSDDSYGGHSRDRYFHRESKRKHHD